MQERFISSRDNPAWKLLRALAHDSRARQKHALTVLDGVHLIEACLDAGGAPVSLWLAEGAAGKAEIATLAARTAGLPQYVLPEALFRQAAPTDTPTGVMALVSPPPNPQPKAEGIVLVLDGVQEPGNVGTLLRTAAAAGVDQVWLTPGCAHAWSPRVLRAGMGAQFVVSIAEGVDALACLCDVKKPVIATALEGAESLFQADLHEDAVWLFGAEGRGVSPALVARATRRLCIPMAGGIESLNVSAAAAICLFEQLRQRTAAPG